MPPRRRSAAAPPPAQRVNYTIPPGAVINFTTIDAPDFKACSMPIGIDRAGRPEVVGLHDLTDEELTRYATANPSMMGWAIARVLARRLTGWAPPVAATAAAQAAPKSGKAARARAARRAVR